MNSSNIGAILKSRIKELNFTQTEFAEKAGIGVSTLKKYISGQLPYSIELLDKFSELLNCSYEYLLGKSPKPHGSFLELQRLTGLSNSAIKNLLVIIDLKNENINESFVALEKLMENLEILDYIGTYLLYAEENDPFLYQRLYRQQTGFGGVELSVNDIPDLLVFKVERLIKALHTDMNAEKKEHNNPDTILSKEEIDSILKEQNIEWSEECGKYTRKKK
ncbi:MULTISPECIES: helix-turn-helix transcriptional regulator [unclassified Ruminococcus]|uniref:helix-turn-helix domain-containing protein n=1 Tax=unclassified Ruminococcus TaxID=2608920 RepID=UPI002108C82E